MSLSGECTVANPESLPTVEPVKKGRRGLAKRLTGPMLSKTVSLSSTSHNAAVYSSCVSKGFQNLLGDMTSSHENVHDKSDSTPLTNPNTDVTEETSKKEEGSDDEVQVNTEEKEQLNIVEVGDDEEGEDVEAVAGPESLRSPTPPPSAEGPTLAKRRRMNKKLKSALNTLNKAKGNLNLAPTTPFSMARARKGRKKAWLEQAESDLLALDETPTKQEMLVKVRYLSSVYRMPLKMTQPFHHLLIHLSQVSNQPEQYLTLFLNDEALPLSKTPKDVQLTVADIIECHCIKAPASKEDNSGSETLCLLIQCSHSKRKTEINVTNRQPFSEVLENYAEKAGIDASSYTFCFDGENVTLTDSPLTLDMEDGDILDLVPRTISIPRSRRKAMQNSVITII